MTSSEYGRRPGDYDVHIASTLEKKRLWWRNAIINLLFIAAWFLFALLLSLYNKWMFSPDHFGFPYPLFVTTLHQVVQFGLAALLRFIWPHKFRPDKSPSRRDYGKKVVPTGIATCLDIGLSNVSLRTITLSFYTMVKSASLVFVLFFAFLFKLETFSLRLVGVVMLIVAGVLLMVATETHFVLGGFILVLSASALGGLRWALTQRLLRSKDMGLENPAATLFWLTPVMATFLFFLSVVVERWWAIFDSKFFDGVGATLHTVFFLGAPGVIAFCMVLSEFYIIRRAGMVPMSIAGIAKEVATISVSSFFFHDKLTALNFLGVAITICGIILYTYHKYRKSLDATVPLDAHGNPIEEEVTDEGHLELSETEHLAARMSRDSFERDDVSTLADTRTLFEVGDDDEAEELRSVTSAKVGGVHGSQRIHDSINNEDYSHR